MEALWPEDRTRPVRAVFLVVLKELVEHLNPCLEPVGRDALRISQARRASEELRGAIAWQARKYEASVSNHGVTRPTERTG